MRLERVGEVAGPVDVGVPAGRVRYGTACTTGTPPPPRRPVGVRAATAYCGSIFITIFASLAMPCWLGWGVPPTTVACMSAAPLKSAHCQLVHAAPPAGGLQIAGGPDLRANELAVNSSRRSARGIPPYG